MLSLPFHVGPVSRLARSAALLGGLTFAGGCASLDPAPDVDRAEHLVADRAGALPDWTQPWEPALGLWDGHAPLRLQTALEMALRNNRDLRAEVERIAASRADLVQSGLLPNPVLGVTLRFPFDPISGGSFVGAQVVQAFTALWLRDGRIAASEARLNQTILDVSDRALSLVAEVKASHARLAFGQHLLQLGGQSVQVLEASTLAAEARVRAGEASQAEITRALQAEAIARAAQDGIVRELAKERRRLLELIGFAGESAEWPVEEPPPPDPVPVIDEADAVMLAITQRLDTAAARLIVDAQRAELSTEELSRLKDFGLGADFEREVDGQRTIGPVIEASIPIFDTNQAQIAKAGALARASLAKYEAVRQRAIREVRVAWMGLAGATRLASQFRERELALSEQLLALSQRSLASGQGDLSGLLNARQMLLEARSALVALEREATLANINFERALGGAIASNPGEH